MKRKGATQLTPMCCSRFWAVLFPASTAAMPALFQRTSRRDSCAAKAEAEALIVARLSRSRCRYFSWPVVVEVGELLALMAAIATWALLVERAAM